ncbi:tRNA (adenosine(37)-N6)-threonylcarbamoyltransferase complex dimerization subunit type 1 TsaB [Methylocapsa sp. S129]|uniref:tRNA (adenosine(37)-N6)-threonylcarbamoyltransferase complex dimerization subunit type 1 TsaB n=1 Tax=Methylocapsa sp. S129 TaxID=1641869 RepID=UPI00131C2027|nr:tRNA (adenosine(37)-N6)-threonylcarbamoyltransferase complex dimerization subunit type 1 TsaB [Methylocapsa sp. S129]
MRILAIDTSCGAVSACVLDSGADEAIARRSEPMERGHAEALAPMLEQLMFGVEGGFASLDRIAATVGPGSFTGIRVGLATARAMGLALNVPVIGVSTLVAFAGPLLFEPSPGIIASAIDARHGRVYLQLFESVGRPLIPARIEGLREAVRAIGAGPVRMTGSGARILALEAARVGLGADLTGSVDFPDILAVARIGLALDPRDCPPRPLYLKSPDARPATGEGVARANP